MTYKTDSGKNLKTLFNIKAQHCLYHKKGNWYHILKKFPGALCDQNGFILFEIPGDYYNCSDLNIDKKTNTVHIINGKTIAEIPGYIKKR